MRKNMNKLCSIPSLIVSFALLIAGCTTTPQSENTDEVTSANSQQNVAEETTEAQATTVYEVDNADDVRVNDLPTAPVNNEASIKSSAPQEYIVQQGIHYGISLVSF